MIRNIINAIKSNILVVWTRILLEKLEEVISLTSCYGSTNQFRNVSKLQGIYRFVYMRLKRECLLEQ